MSVATFNNTMASMTVSFSDREIYNDIRSQIDITVTNVVIDDPLVSYGNEEYERYGNIYNLKNGESKSITITGPEAYKQSYLHWTGENAIGYPISGSDTYILNIVVDSSDLDSITITVTNNSGIDLLYAKVTAIYVYTSLTGIVPQSHTETGTETLTIRSIDATSIAAYGRRSMNLTWPLGQTQEQTQALADAYLVKYKDPVPVLTMSVLGKTQAIATTLLGLKISDLITIINTELGLNGDYYINTIDVSHNCDGLLLYTFGLEQQRLYESYTLFTIDTSEIDGSHVLAY